MQRTISVINLPAIRRNVAFVKTLIGNAKLYAVVKADAYGHGAEEVARYIQDIVGGFCVAIIDEGVALRIAGITKPILVFTPPMDRYDVMRAKAYSLTVTVNSQETARLTKGLPCHIKVNTGMNRLGCSPYALYKIIDETGLDRVEGIYSHLYAPDDSEAAKTQLAAFSGCVSLVKSQKPGIVAHLAASGGILAGEKYLFDGVRAGILLYGYTPHGFKKASVSPALKVYTKRVQTSPFSGGGVGYGRASKNYKNLSVYRLGYADGFSRTVPLGENNLCMDSFISKSCKKTLCVMSDADEYTARSGTIAYEVLTKVTKRSLRVYKR